MPMDSEVEAENPSGAAQRSPSIPTTIQSDRHSEQGSNSSILSSISSSIPFLFLIASVIGLLQLSGLFDTHPANMWITEAALLMFCFLDATQKKINETHWATYFQIIDKFRLLSGTLVLVSLSSIPLPHQLWWLFFAVWVLLAFIVLCTSWIYPTVEGMNVDRDRHSATQTETRISFDSNVSEGTRGSVHSHIILIPFGSNELEMNQMPQTEANDSRSVE